MRRKDREEGERALCGGRIGRSPAESRDVNSLNVRAYCAFKVFPTTTHAELTTGICCEPGH